ncbi:MAG: hypothetical protein ACE5FJ_01855 [Gemmatimonadales bacterium]
MTARKIIPLAIWLALPGAIGAQTVQLPDISGTWESETPDGPQLIIIRSDSSASYGDETVRWRLEADSIHIAFGDEWTVYGLVVDGEIAIMSGGDLEEPVELRRVGPPTPRPEGVEVPPAPPADSRAVL